MRNSSQRSQAERIRAELVSLGAEAEIESNFGLASIKDGKVCAEKYAFCVFLDKDKIAARLLEKSGLRLFNSCEAIETCDDKMLTHIALANNGVSMPDCIYAPLRYTPNLSPDGHFINTVKTKLGFPLVAKINYGSLGAGVGLIRNEDELKIFEERNMLAPHFYQQFIDCGAGEDIRVIVVGGKFLCAMKRHNDNDFRSNIELGGTGSVYQPDDKLIELCEKVARLLNLDYCGIDILTNEDGKRYVCEVNSNAFFAAAERVCQVNVAREYASHMINLVKKLVKNSQNGY